MTRCDGTLLRLLTMARGETKLSGFFTQFKGHNQDALRFIPPISLRTISILYHMQQDAHNLPGIVDIIIINVYKSSPVLEL